VREGQYGTHVDIRSRDEIEDLGSTFNQMTDEIRDQIDKVMRLNQANAKFVPDQFLSFLGKQSILDIRLGDQVQREMTVLFSDIRSFTSLSEGMSPEENFAFINTYLKVMGPLIRENHGFIDKYIGDAIMALFPGGPDDALRAALAMSRSLRGLNAGVGSGEIRIGVGVHTGSLMLGIVGEEMRYDGTVISDAVNLASRLESLTKYYGVHILASGASVDRLGADGPVESRFLDRVSVKGKSEPVVVNEVISPLDPLRERKLRLRTHLRRAYDLYAAGRMEAANQIFGRLCDLLPGDDVPRIFLRRVETMRRQGVPTDWQGVTVFAEK
jgi:class 3 adenylate cyclase